VQHYYRLAQSGRHRKREEVIPVATFKNHGLSADPEGIVTRSPNDCLKAADLVVADGDAARGPRDQVH
jgi:hypothetical protein